MPLRSLLLSLLLAICGGALAEVPPVTLADGRVVQVPEATLAALPSASVVATAHEHTATYTGFALREVLKAAGVQTEALRGKTLASTVTVVAGDGYRVVFSLGELDPSLGNRQVLLVDRQDGKPLPAGEGPWRLVVPADARPARWVRQVRSLIVSDPVPAPATPAHP